MSASEAVRALNSAGVRRFRSYLEQLREDGTDIPPMGMLTDSNLTEGVPGALITTRRAFPNRLALAAHLHEVLGNVDRRRLDGGLWSWLSLFHFDAVCPPREDGSRRPGVDERHVLDPSRRRNYRHLLAGAFIAYDRYRERAALMLHSAVPTDNRFHRMLAERPALFGSDAVIDAANALYLNRRGTRPKPGVHKGGRTAPGSLHRFVDIVQQLELNYDLNRMTGDALLDLLPPEFDRHKPLRKRLRRRRQVPG